MSGARPLLPADVAHLHLRFDSHFDRQSLREHVRDLPGLAWTNDQYEYIVTDHWKSRNVISVILELSGPGRGFRGILPSALRDAQWPMRRTELIEGVLTNLREHGCRLVLLGEKEAHRSMQPFLATGFELIEDIVYYRKPDCAPSRQPSPLVLRPLRLADMEDLVELEQRVFPWLWWYGEDEWHFIRMLADVETNLAYRDGVLVGYETHTVTDGHGHLDRLGIESRLQGNGLGEELLKLATTRIADLGGREIGLSTQRSNHRARRLYEKHGFRLTSQSLRYHGRILDESVRSLLETPDGEGLRPSSL